MGKKNQNSQFKKESIIFYITLFSLPSIVSAATLYFSPSSGSYNLGQTFSVNAVVSSTTQSMNAASGVVSFPQDKLQVVSLSKTGSIINLWVLEPSFSNNTGTVSFEGVVLNPGFTGSSGKVITINFKGKEKGTASISFSEGLVLANDGKGTNILSEMGSGTYTIVSTIEEEYLPPSAPAGVPEKPIVASPTHPDPDKWYSNNDPEFTWKLPSDVTGVSLLLNEKPTSNPGNISDGLIKSKKYEDINDGMWYFHIKFKNEYGWGKITHRKVLIDTEPPKPFEIKVDNEGDSTNPTPKLYFETTDEPSGIDYYELKIGQGDNFPVITASLKTNPYQVPLQVPGEHPVVVNALDKAKNSTTATANIIVDSLQPPEITKYPKELKEGEILEIEGKTIYPNSIIIVYIQKEEGQLTIEEVRADEKGNWVYTYEKCTRKGAYKIWAKVKDSRGAISRSFQEVTSLVTLPALLRIGKIAIDYLTTVITLIVLIIGAIAVIFYAWYRISLWRKRIRAETKEVAQAVFRAFRALREEVGEQIEYLDKKPGVTPGEKKVRDKLKEALDVSEEFISKELKDIEKELE